VKAVQVSLWPWCLTGRLGSIYMTGNSSGRIAESKDWIRCSYIWSLGLYGLFNTIKGFLLVYIYYSSSIAFGASATITSPNQLMVSSNVTAFNMEGLAVSTGTGAGTILEFDSAGKVLPTAWTYLAIDTVIAAIYAPYAMSWASNSEYTYDSSQPLAIWDTLCFGNSANMASKSIWTCPAAGLWHIAATFGFSMNTNDQPCSFQLFQNSSEVWYFTAWGNISTATEGITTQCKSIFLNLAAGNTLEWYLGLGGCITMTIIVILATLRLMPLELLLDTPPHNQGCCNIFIVGVQLSDTLYKYPKVEHPKTEDTARASTYDSWCLVFRYILIISEN